MTRKRITPSTETAARARAALRPLAPGASTTIELPDGVFWRREGYRAVSGAAHGLWGSGNYRLNGRDKPGTVTVTRLPTALNDPALRPGDVVWRIHLPDTDEPRSIRCIFVRHAPGAITVTRSPSLARDFQHSRADDVFTDRAACRAEIKRRANATKEPTP